MDLFFASDQIRITRLAVPSAVGQAATAGKFVTSPRAG
jgi:hypothetical protein